MQTAHTLCPLAENSRRFEFFACKMFVDMSSFVYFDQGRRSCPGASCTINILLDTIKRPRLLEADKIKTVESKQVN